MNFFLLYKKNAKENLKIVKLMKMKKYEKFQSKIEYKTMFNEKKK